MTFTREQSKAKPIFWRRFRKLSPRIQALAQKRFEDFLENPANLRFKRLKNKTRPYYTARVTGNYRVVGEIIGDTIYWEFIGNHSAYEDYISTLE